MLDNRTIDFIISIVRRARFEDEEYSIYGDNPRVPPFKEDVWEYDLALYELEKLKKEKSHV